MTDEDVLAIFQLWVTETGTNTRPGWMLWPRRSAPDDVIAAVDVCVRSPDGGVVKAAVALFRSDRPDSKDQVIQTLERRLDDAIKAASAGPG